MRIYLAQFPTKIDSSLRRRTPASILSASREALSQSLAHLKLSPSSSPPSPSSSSLFRLRLQKPPTGLSSSSSSCNLNLVPDFGFGYVANESEVEEAYGAGYTGGGARIWGSSDIGDSCEGYCGGGERGSILDSC
ncbi:hypothetical protein NL676_013844 [Syzygium grande]|nr:hypothetical protein NL676_013844 [Syzygium grande]